MKQIPPMPCSRSIGPATRLLVAAWLVALTSCSATFDAEKAPMEPAATGSADSPGSGGKQLGLTGEAKNKAQDPKANATPRKIIRNGELRVAVKAYAPAREAIDAMLKRSGGYVSSSNVHHSLGEVSSATLVLRVPAASFGSILSAIAGLGVVQSESTSSEDITEAYYDLTARLKNARKLEARLLELLQTQTNKVTDLLQVEKELARVRGEIEGFEGKLRLYDNLVGLSTLTVHLDIRKKYVPPRPPTLLDDITSSLGGSWSALVDTARGLLLVAVALLPWVLPLGLAGWLIVRLVRWIRRRKRRS